MSNEIETQFGVLEIPARIEAAITTPHDHEGPNNRPLWLVWKMDIGSDGITDGPQLDSICDTERSIRYHVAMMLERQESTRREGRGAEFRFHVERVPANHNFGRSDLTAYEQFVTVGKNRADMIRFRHSHKNR